MTSLSILWIVVAALCVVASQICIWFGLERIARRQTDFKTALLWSAGMFLPSQAPYREYSTIAAVVIFSAIFFAFKKSRRYPVDLRPRGTMKERLSLMRSHMKLIFTRQLVLALCLYAVAFASGIPFLLHIHNGTYILVAGFSFFGCGIAGAIVTMLWFFKIFPVLMRPLADALSGMQEEQ